MTGRLLVRGTMSAFSKGPLPTIGRTSRFIGLCVALLFIGLVKGMIVWPIVAVLMFVGHMAVVLGLWPVHVVYAFYSIAKTKRLGFVVKVLSLLLLPIPLLLWPVVVAVGSVLVGLGYGFGTPLVATFEAVGEDRDAKLYHTFLDGTVGTLTGSCTVVRDFTDLCFHSYFDYVQDFYVREPKDGKPFDINLLEIPGCVAVGLLGIVADGPLISIVAVAKSPLMLLKGWGRLLQDLVGRQGACLEAACVPFAGLAIILWPLVVVVTVVFAVLSSPFLGLFSAVVVYQETSLQCGLAYIVAIVAEFDEYTNDVLHLNEGSCLPRPNYRKMGIVRSEAVVTSSSMAPRSPDGHIFSPTGIPQLTTSKSLRQALQEVKIVQIWDHMFKNIEIHGKALVEADILMATDLDAWIRSSKNPKNKIIAVGLPAYCTLHVLLASAKAGVAGLLLTDDGTEVTMFNRPQDRVLDWFFEPLLTLKEQLRLANLKYSEEHYLEKLVLTVGDTARMEAWNNGGVEPEDGLRKGELQALSRRLQGIATSISRLPTYRRHYRNFIKGLLVLTCERYGCSLLEITSGSDSSRPESPESSIESTPRTSSGGDNAV